MKKWSSGALGVLGIGIFFVWLVARFWPPLHDLLDVQSLFGVLGTGIAWLFLLGGAALLAHALWGEHSAP